MTGSRISTWAVVLAFAAGLAAIAPAQETAPPDTANMPFRNPQLSPVQRAEDLVHRLTLEEKASQMVNQSRAIPRLGIPSYDWWSEALHGVIADGTTEFPEPIGLGATFDAPVIHQMATDIGIEGRIKNAQAVKANKGYSGFFQGLDFWAPNINIFRDPRWGRGQETYGEDPFLTGRMGVAFVTGMQGDDPRYYRVISTPKHFVVHSGPEPTRHFADVDVSKHDELDTYLPAFRAARSLRGTRDPLCAPITPSMVSPHVPTSSRLSISSGTNGASRATLSPTAKPSSISIVTTATAPHWRREMPSRLSAEWTTSASMVARR